MTAPNPYAWRDSTGEGESVERDDLITQAIRQLSVGNVIVVGGYGTGKTWLLRQIEARLRASGDAVLFLDGPPTIGGLPEVIRVMLRLIEPDAASLDPLVTGFVRGRERGSALEDLSDQAISRLPLPELMRSALDARGIERAVAIFDEADRYVDRNDGENLGRKVFNHLEHVTRELKGRLRVIAAGGIGVYGLKTMMGSAFIDNAKWTKLSPFTVAQMRALAQPFWRTGRELSDEAFEQMRINTGGHAALTVYGLQSAWTTDIPMSALDVTRVFHEFARDTPEFIRNYWSKIADPKWSDAAERLLHALKTGESPHSIATLQRAIAGQSGALPLSLDQVLDLLVAAGAARETAPRGSTTGEIYVELIPSVLIPPSRAPSDVSDTRTMFVSELVGALTNMHRFASAWFSGDGDNRTLVPEANLAASVAVQLLQRGVPVDLEAVRGPGRTDILAELNASGRPRKAVAETKIWGRNDYASIHAQTCGYWTDDVDAAVAVTFTDRGIDDWTDKYAQQCLVGQCETHQLLTHRAPLIAHFEARSTLPDGRSVVVDHMLLQMPRPPRAQRKAT